jgi:RHS repeat-associated protein
MTTSPPLVSGGSLSAWTYEHDILGNRTRRNASTANHAHPMRYDWDVLNRATLIAQPSGGAGYAYRADGQRIEKVEGITFSWSGSRESGQYDTNYAQNRPTSRYYYDGQMGFEDDYNPSGTITKVTRNVLGARGIDRISITENSATTHGYPLYDGHGNCRGVLTKNGTSYGTGNWRTYDVWGSVRSGSATGDPKSRYVASIWHVADDESSLIYMRARYYEPATGRFISEDSAMDGKNWYIYCGNEPVHRVDRTGLYSEKILQLWLFEIESLSSIAIEAKIIFMAACKMWVAEIMLMGAAGFL